MLLEAERTNDIRGFACSRGGPRVSHLFFADDSLVFCQADREKGGVIKRILENYEKASGQKVNFSKSAISFSPNTSEEIQRDIKAILGLDVTAPHDKYLGLPTLVGRNKRKTFAAIKERLWKKLQTWKGRLFSQGGREVLIKAVALAIPIYTMGLFRLPKTLCEEMQQLVARYWWGGDSNTKHLHWKKWELLCRPKVEGGLGFRDLEVFNQAMLAKQGWRLIQSPSSLAARILRGKYFASGSFLTAQLGGNPSFSWRSILWGRELLKLGMRWKIGNGERVSVFNDPWLPRPYSFLPITRSSSVQTELKVKDLINATDNCWNMEAVEAHLWPIDHNEVLKVPIGLFRGEDSLLWHFDKKGEYSVRSGYKAAIESRNQVGGSSNEEAVKWWKYLWGLRIPPKVKIFIWRCFHEILPTAFNLERRHVSVSPRCYRCGEDGETIFHALISCRLAIEVWEETAFWANVNDCVPSSFDYFLLRLYATLNKAEFEAFCMLLWGIWYERNKCIHGLSSREPVAVVEGVGRLLYDYQEIQKIVKSEPSHLEENRKVLSWIPPDTNSLKLNVDAAVRDASRFSGVGGIIRDNLGMALGAFAKRIQGVHSPLMAELYAIREGLRFAIESGLRASCIESDSANAITAINGLRSKAAEETIVQDIRMLLVNNGGGICQSISRQGNNVAHLLAQFSFVSPGDCFWLEETPSCVLDAVNAEMALI